MRQTKFRAWCESKKKMLSWSELLAEPELLRCALSGEAWMTNPPQTMLTPLEFTGLLDKNGKEIYEGDIVNAHAFTYEGGDIDIVGAITMQGACFGIQDRRVIEEDGGHWLFHDTSHYEEPCIEVIGNIYENPELLNE